MQSSCSPDVDKEQEKKENHQLRLPHLFTLAVWSRNRWQETPPPRTHSRQILCLAAAEVETTFKFGKFTFLLLFGSRRTLDWCQSVHSEAKTSSSQDIHLPRPPPGPTSGHTPWPRPQTHCQNNIAGAWAAQPGAPVLSVHPGGALRNPPASPKTNTPSHNFFGHISS